MAGHAAQDVTQLLLDWSRGDRAALDRLMPLVSAELRRLAHRYMRREPAGQTLQTTALVNEAYLRLVDGALAVERTRRPASAAVFFRQLEQALSDRV